MCGAADSRAVPAYEGQMYSIGLAMKLRPGAYAEYKRAHDDLWPDLARGMAENAVSIRLHERLGFELIGTEREVGFKFGRWLDSVHMELLLGGAGEG